MSFSLADAQAHAAKHGYQLGDQAAGRAGTAEKSPGAATGRTGALPKPVKMTRPEKEMGMMLEVKKRSYEIVDYRFQGMSLAYSPDPETGILLRYKCDYVVITDTGYNLGGGVKDVGRVDYVSIKIIECKGFGRHAISAAAKLRFKGAKAAWPWFQFEMWQRERAGNWRRVL